MIKLIIVFVTALLLAFISERNTKAICTSGKVYSIWKDWAYLLLVAVLVLHTGLRREYNDTGNYIGIFKRAPGFVELLSTPGSLKLMSNPLYYLFQSALKSITNNAQVLIFLTSLFTQCCFVRFIKRYSSNFVFGIFLYFTLGTFALTMAAIKQVVAMAILTLAIPYLERKQLGRYFLLVFTAMLMHTYAVAFVVLPLFTMKPWSWFTYAFAIVTIWFLFNFQDVVTTFLEQADELGKDIAEYEVFDNISINIFRVAVYAVPVVISLLFQKWLFRDSTRIENVLVHMSVISLACMSMGTQSGANMFGRMANYFELGTACALPWMLEKIFERKTYRLISACAVVGFLGFFTYANVINPTLG